MVTRMVARTPGPVDLLIPLLTEPPDLSVLQDDASWKIIQENAGRYGVAALIAYAVRPHVSHIERVWCDTVLIDNWRRYERMLGHLDYVLGLLASAGIPTIALKGPLLARRYFDPPFLRKPSVDLDLAVTGQHLARACEVLVNAGYIQDRPIPEAQAWSHHIGLSNPARARLELHFKLSHQAVGIPVDEFFERSVRCTLPSGRETQILGPADQLLHLLLHFAHSRFGTLFHLYEIRRVFRAEPPKVRHEAIQRAIDHHFCGVLRMVDVAFGVRWGERFLPEDLAVPSTWLNWRLNEKLYRSFELYSEPGLALTLRTRLRARSLEFQITDGLSEAFSYSMLLLRTARFQFAAGGWGTAKNLTYGPGYSTPPSRGK
ncbi:MAG TPA: nucleotidyltransferase family protein [Bryobacteraceae bacterium]|nr:nucleotidyltransferase family protein [Bryobacteraceae bacterium]